MTRLAKVYSFQRSGTYYLCSLLKARFYLKIKTGGGLPKYLDTITCGEINGKPGKYIPPNGLPFKGWGMEPTGHCKWKRLFGGHILVPTARILKPGSLAIYLTRDGRDVMVSLFRLRNRVRDTKIAFKDWYYQFRPLPIAPYVFPKDIPIAGLWWWSTQQWQARGERIFQVSYEQLLKDKERQLDRIAKFLGRNKRGPHPAEKNLVGIAPNDGQHVGRWQEFFDESAIQYWQECKEKAIELVQTGGMQWPE